MDPEQLPDPQDLWWSAVALAALHRVGGQTGCRLGPQLVVSLDSDRGWLRLQRCRGERFVMWGRSDLAPPAPRDARRGAPDWALSDATDDGRPTFVAWFAHGEWDATDDPDEGVVALLRPWLAVDPRLGALAARGDASAQDLLRHAGLGAPDATAPSTEPDVTAAAALLLEAAAPAPVVARGPVLVRLRDQVHGQMREAVEADRMLLQQPPEVSAWAQVHAPRGRFEHAVLLRRGEASPAVTNTALPRAARQALANVLRDLHLKESDDAHGGWLFARVSGDGTVVRFDRVFDHWPSWWRVAHAAQGPTLDDLAWEMSQRDPAWRPGWASLLPALGADSVSTA